METRVSNQTATVTVPMAQQAVRGRRRPSRLRRLGRTLGIQVVSVAVFLTLWQWVGGQMNPILLATPTAVMAAFIDLVATNQLQAAFVMAMADLTVGFALAIIVGIVVGVAMGRSRTIEQVLNPYINFMQATPLVALVPLIVVWFGIGYEARVAVVFVLAVWSIIINTSTGVKATPKILMEVAQTYHLSTFDQLRAISLPSAVPFIFSGLRIGLGKALIGMVIAEMEVSVVGLGGLLNDYGMEFKTAYLLAGIATASMVGVLTAVGLEFIQARFFPWVHATSSRHQA